MGTDDTTGIENCFVKECSAKSAGYMQLRNLIDLSKLPEIYATCWHHKTFYEKKTSKTPNIDFSFKPTITKKRKFIAQPHRNTLGSYISTSNLQKLKKSLESA